MPADRDPQALLSSLLAAAAKAGAETADASVSVRESLSVEVRKGALEGVEREESRSLALRVLIGKQQAAATTTDLSPRGVGELAERVAAMAKLAPEDPYCGLLDARYRATRFPDLQLHAGEEPSAAVLEKLALEAEAAAAAVPGVTNISSAGAGWGAGRSAYATSDGFYGLYEGSSTSLSVVPIAERDGAKERDYDYRTVRRLEEMPAPESLGRNAGERVVARLGARKIATATAPVIFENRLAGRLIGPLFGAISGNAIARGVSFLRDKLGEPVFGAHVTIEDDPLRIGGLGSHPFDGEGGAVKASNLIDKGVLTSWLMNSAAARQLGLEPTGHATWGHGGPPGIGASNVTVQPGADDLDALMRNAGAGLVVTEMFSPSLNANTGDWSVGVAGYWFEGGARAYPVNEVTVAGNLKDIFARLIPGADLERRGGLDSPSILVDALAIAGT